jgi:hypothetical protein
MPAPHPAAIRVIAAVSAWSSGAIGIAPAGERTTRAAAAMNAVTMGLLIPLLLMLARGLQRENGGRGYS